MKALKERYELIESSNGELYPLIVFAEAGTTNGSGIIKFKRGAFYDEKRIRPYFMKYDPHRVISIAYDCVEQVPMVMLQLSWLGCHFIEFN